MPESGRYTILREIASGSTATVYLAMDTLLRRKVALKRLHPHLHNHAEMVSRFAQEAVAIAALSHENVIKIFEYGNQERDLFLAMEYIEGSTLESLLKDGGEGRGLPNVAALSLFRQLLEGLSAAHAHGIVHRDIKPSNVLIDRAGGVHLADFGIAYLSADTSITRTGSFLGTPGYSAPEQSEGLAATEKTDVFTAGIVFYRCLTGRLPFVGDTPHQVLRAILEKDPPRVSAVNPRVLPGLPDLCALMLAKRPEERPSARECIRQLESVAERSGFAFDASRLALFMDQGAVYRAAEEMEISDAFRARAVRARKKREPREALMAYTVAEAFAAEPGPIRAELEGYQRSLRAAVVKRRAAVGLAIACVSAAGLASWVRRSSQRASAIPAVPASTTAGTAASGDASLRPAGPGEARSATPVAMDIEQTADPAPPPPAPLPHATPPQASPRPSMPRSSETSGSDGLAGKTARNGMDMPKVSSPKEGPVSAPPPTEDSTARPSEPALPKSLAPTPAVGTGYATFKSTPPFARIFVDGKDAGTTPLKAPLKLAVGNHDLILEKEGCRPLHASFAVGSADTIALRYTLETVSDRLP